VRLVLRVAELHLHVLAVLLDRLASEDAGSRRAPDGGARGAVAGAALERQHGDRGESLAEPARERRRGRNRGHRVGRGLLEMRGDVTHLRPTYCVPRLAAIVARGRSGL
jgi:hypothetical protein